MAPAVAAPRLIQLIARLDVKVRFIGRTNASPTCAPSTPPDEFKKFVVNTFELGQTVGGPLVVEPSTVQSSPWNGEPVTAVVNPAGDPV